MDLIHWILTNNAGLGDRMANGDNVVWAMPALVTQQWGWLAHVTQSSKFQPSSRHTPFLVLFQSIQLYSSMPKSRLIRIAPLTLLALCLLLLWSQQPYIPAYSKVEQRSAPDLLHVDNGNEHMARQEDHIQSKRTVIEPGNVYTFASLTCGWI